MGKYKYLTAALFLTMSSTVMAAKPGTEPPPSELATGYLGYTTISFNGDTTMPGLYAQCQKDYGEDVVVCNTKQLFESPSIAGETAPDSGMWVRPYIVSESGAGGLIDYSGAFGAVNVMCDAATAGNGVIVNLAFIVRFERSCALVIPAACCR